MKYILLILFLTTSVGCQTMAGKKTKKAEVQRDEKSEIRKLSHVNIDTRSMPSISVMNCECTSDNNSKPISIFVASEKSEALISLLVEECTEELFKKLRRGTYLNLPRRVTLYNCWRETVNVNYNNNIMGPHPGK